MKTAKWNLQATEIRFLTVTQITMHPNLPDPHRIATHCQLLVLSHSIAYSGTPAIFLETPPSYSQSRSFSNVVIVFDFDHSFDHFTLSPELFVTSHCVNSFSNEFLDHFQRALTLHSLYELRDYSPLYFTTF
jgi:hypothetical protein